MADEHPLVGVGPGNFAHELQFYRPGSGHGGAHNSYLQMLAETGYLGLFLYLVFFLTALISLTHTQRSFDRRWQAHVAWMLQLSLIGYLALGVFNNRNDLVLAYILAGCSVALRATKVK
jgi:O-antigen ligase